MNRLVLLLIASAFAGAASGAAADTFERTVKANARTAIGGFFGYEVNTCYPSVIPDAKVRQEPAHGSVAIVPHEQVLGKENRCAGRKVRGIAFVYTPQKGFKGLDELSIDLPWAGTDTGMPIIRTHHFRIQVE